MPEGDTIHRAAGTLHAALAGQRIERFESVFPHLTRIDAEQPIAGRCVERVKARGKHVLMWIEGDLVLRTHMRMHGSWHIWPRSDPRYPSLRVASDSIYYRASRGPGERWQRPRHELRILIATSPYVALAPRPAPVWRRGPTWTLPTRSSTSARSPASATCSNPRCCSRRT
jgi:endonuclease-8